MTRVCLTWCDICVKSYALEIYRNLAALFLCVVGVFICTDVLLNEIYMWYGLSSMFMFHFLVIYRDKTVQMSLNRQYPHCCLGWMHTICTLLITMGTDPYKKYNKINEKQTCLFDTTLGWTLAPSAGIDMTQWTSQIHLGWTLIRYLNLQMCVGDAVSYATEMCWDARWLRYL